MPASKSQRKARGPSSEGEAAPNENEEIGTGLGAQSSVRSGSRRSGTEAFGPGASDDEDANVCSAKVLKFAKKIKLSNRATSILGELNEAYTDNANIDRNIRAMVRRVFLNPRNPALGPGEKVLLQVILRRLRKDVNLLGAHGTHQLRNTNTATRSVILGAIKSDSTRMRSDVKKLIRISMIDDEDSSPQTLRELGELVAAKGGVCCSYDVLCRLAWVRKMCTVEGGVSIASHSFWQDIQMELDEIIKLTEVQSRKTFEKALNWDLAKFGKCGTLVNEPAPFAESELKDDFEHADEEQVDEDEAREEPA
ncbi:unnamed protein product [Tilletia caries]|uniref:MAGE domain-containing protein n=1 Tax=Tilletia caries TaxID=13290 RepID=A0ABN7ITJ7_9BASI|nr:unnamed protein product [Tilletia caries]CAD6917466.1 unnamed protein product [Tilletia caries]